jgi:hypothetical protein
MIDRVGGVYLITFLEVGKSLLALLAIVQTHSDVGTQHGGSGVYAKCLLKQGQSFSVVFLLVKDVAKTPPGAVVSIVRAQGFLVALLCLLKVFV